MTFVHNICFCYLYIFISYTIVHRYQKIFAKLKELTGIYKPLLGYRDTWWKYRNSTCYTNNHDRKKVKVRDISPQEIQKFVYIHKHVCNRLKHSGASCKTVGDPEKSIKPKQNIVI